LKSADQKEAKQNVRSDAAALTTPRQRLRRYGAWREGRRAILIKREAEYLADVRRRMALALEGPMTRAHESTNARGKSEKPGPIFDF
jgi:hypothetical protein